MRIRTETLRHSGVIHGPASVVRPAVLMANAPMQYDPVRRAFLIPLRYLPDVEAALSVAGHQVEAVIA